MGAQNSIYKDDTFCLLCFE